MKNILVVSQYSAPHAGNYIASLLDLERFSNNKYNFYYVFPIGAKKCSWINEFEQIMYIDNPNISKYKKNKNVYSQLKTIILEKNIQLIHSNFDGYDIVCSKICKELNISLVISFHNPIVKQKNILKNLYQNIMLQLHYRFYVSNSTVVFVNDDLSKFAKKYGIKNYLCINNGVSLSKIKKKKYFRSKNTKINAFFIAGSRLEAKGLDLLLDYMNKNKGLAINITVFCDENNKKIIEEHNDKRIITKDKYDDINQVINENDIFISLSRKETFQYAIAEAIYGGLFVIKSNCDGTNWANNIPSVQVVCDHNDFETAISSLSDTNKEDVKISQKYIEDNYSTVQWAKKLYKVYDERIEKK